MGESKLRSYFELFKLKQTFLLVYSGVFGYLIAAGYDIDFTKLIIFIIASFLSISGTTGLNMYYDRDIDDIMFRTRYRPLPSGKINPGEAYAVSMTLNILGIAIGFSLNYWVGLAILLGFIIDIYVYTVLLKRRTPLNIVVGAIAGGMPIFGGYMVHTGHPTLKAFMLMLIIACWAMIHIWYIATYYIDDYKRARIPMLPVVVGERKTIYISIIVLSIIALIVAFMFYLGLSTIYSLIISLVFTLVISLLAMKYLTTNDKEYVRKAYKVLNPYQGILLLVFLIEKLAMLV